MTGSCPTCGFDAASLSPPDAVVALRSLPRRFRAQVPGDADDTRTGDVAAAAVRAAASIAAIAVQLHQVLVEESPSLAGPPDPAPAQLVSADEAVDRLTHVVTYVAALAAAQPAQAWTRVGRRGGSTVSAAELIRDAVHAGVHELRDAERGGDAGDDDDLE